MMLHHILADLRVTGNAHPWERHKPIIERHVFRLAEPFALDVRTFFLFFFFLFLITEMPTCIYSLCLPTSLHTPSDHVHTYSLTHKLP